jgi:hypothetical protein
VKRRPLAVTALAVLVGLSLATTACTTAPGTTTPGGAAKAPTDVLKEAAAKTKGQSFKYTLAYGSALTGDGAQDATGANATRNIQYTDAASGLLIKGTVMVAENVLYAKVDLGPLTTIIPQLATLNGKWLSVDKTKIGTTGLAASLAPTPDSVTPETYLAGIVSAEKVSDTEYKGVIDLGVSAPKLAPASEIAKLTAEQKKVPFTATLDSQGRVAKIVLKLPTLGAFPATDFATTYSDYGAPVTVTKPAAADVAPMPETFYQFLK